MINPKINVAAEALSQIYLGAEEFPHIVLDNFLDPTMINAAAIDATWLVNNLETESWRFGATDDHDSQLYKRGIPNIDDMPPAMQLVCLYMNSEPFLEFLRKMSGIEDLMADPTLDGGGFHVTYPGGSLNIHHDFNYKDDLAPERVYRKINLLLYLNEEWDTNWGGNLELWKKDLSAPFKVIELIQNRAVLFNIEGAPHGHPHPLNCSTGENRRSLAFYYYSATPPSNQLYDRAMWLKNGELV
jgi:Rps23 Pro-64 3,4-dihydroxylase Tpa1-like proline 4-hydroxylase